VVVFLLVDVVILTFATSFSTSRLDAALVPDIENELNGINVRYDIICIHDYFSCIIYVIYMDLLKQI